MDRSGCDHPPPGCLEALVGGGSVERRWSSGSHDGTERVDRGGLVCCYKDFLVMGAIKGWGDLSSSVWSLLVKGGKKKVGWVKWDWKLASSKGYAIVPSTGSTSHDSSPFHSFSLHFLFLPYTLYSFHHLFIQSGIMHSTILVDDLACQVAKSPPPLFLKCSGLSKPITCGLGITYWSHFCHWNLFSDGQVLKFVQRFMMKN